MALNEQEEFELLSLERQRAQTPAPKDSPSFLSKYLDVHPLAGAAETIASLGSGAIAGPVAGYAGAVQQAMGNKGVDTVHALEQKLTYEPRTTAGKGAMATISYPFQKLHEVADKAALGVSGATGSDLAGATTGAAIDVAPALLGPIAKVIPKVGPSAVDLARQQALDAPKAAQIVAAREAGLKLTPQEGGGGALTRGAASFAGEPRLAKLASNKNAEPINAMIRRDVGLPEDIPLSRDALMEVRQEAGKAYEAVKGAGRIDLDAKFKADLYEANRSINEAAKELPHRADSASKKTFDSLNGKDSLDANTIIEEVKNLRADSDKAYRSGDKQLGAAYKRAANALDDQLERALSKNPDPALQSAVSDYRAARERIAKTYAADKALNETTGNIDAAVYGRELKKGAKLSGDALQVAEFSRAFPRSLQVAEKTGATGPTAFDWLLSGGSGTIGAVLGGLPGIAAAGIGMARPGLRSALLAEPVQNAMAAPRSYAPGSLEALRAMAARRGTAAGIVGSSNNQ